MFILLYHYTCVIKSRTHLPGQFWLLHCRCSVSLPSQSSPPCCGTGALQLRFLVRIPPPHGRLHLSHSFQFDQPPSTKKYVFNDVYFTFYHYLDDKFAFINPAFCTVKLSQQNIDISRRQRANVIIF